MRKHLIFFIILTLAPVLKADTFKLMGGINLLTYSILSQEENTDWQYNASFCAGAGIEIDLTYNKIIAIEIDGLYIQKKGSFAEDADKPHLKKQYSLNTLCVPILSRIRLTSKSPFYFLSGGQISFILSHKFLDIKEKLHDLKENTKKIDYGLVVGCGYQKSVSSNQSMFVEARYIHGMSNILDETYENQSLKTHTILIVLGIQTQ
jgi:opacity protein-like surface antigen